MDQAMYLFSNQYYPDVTDKVYQAVRATTWDHCVHTQKATTQQYLYGGPVTEFVQDEVLNEKMGFPAHSYTHFIPTRLLDGNQKYILRHFILGKETFSLREMLQNKHFSDQYIFHLADYIFMNLRCRVVQNGTWLIIPVGTKDGLTQAFMDELMSGEYGSEYSYNQWFLERRPKVSYAYKEATFFSLVQNGNRVYLDAFTEGRDYFKLDAINDWKICVSDRSDNLPLMRASCSNLCIDGNGRGYLELSENFVNYIRNATFQIHCFLYHEGDKAGFTITPNYLGPSGYLFTKFDEYIATINKERLKVMVEAPNGDWTVSDAVDKKFPTLDTIVVGFVPDACWVAIPTRTGVSPIYPSDFRVWEYDWERDTIGRMVSVDMEACFPNIYMYKYKSDAEMLMIEWFRDDHTVESKYDDFTNPYREYVGNMFYEQMIHDEVPAIIRDFSPYHCKFDVTDFVRHLLMESSHDYRVQELTDLLHETGLHYDTLNEALFEKNRRYRTHVFKMAEMPNIYQRILDTGFLRVMTHADTLCPYDLYIDGKHIVDTRMEWDDYCQHILIPLDLLTDHSVIIVDLYENTFQGASTCEVETDGATVYAHLLTEELERLSTLNEGQHLILNYFNEKTYVAPIFPLDYVSGSDIVVTDTNRKRIPLDNINYGLYARELVAQVPYGLIDWEKLGISQDDPRIVERTGISDDGKFKALTFTLLLPLDLSYVHLLTDLCEKITTKDGEHILVRAGTMKNFNPIFFAEDDSLMPRDITGVPSANRFTKRVPREELIISVKNTGSDELFLYNANCWRAAGNDNLGESAVVSITNFAGIDDPNRIVAFVNGELVEPDLVSGNVPQKMMDDFHITIGGAHLDGDRGAVVYLPFPVDRFSFTTDGEGWANLAETGICGVCKEDMLFINGLRYPTEDFQFISNQIVKCPAVGQVTLIRMHRDGNLFGFNDTRSQSFLDVLYQQSPGFKQYVMNHID